MKMIDAISAHFAAELATLRVRPGHEVRVIVESGATTIVFLAELSLDSVLAPVQVSHDRYQVIWSPDVAARAGTGWTFLRVKTPVRARCAKDLRDALMSDMGGDELHRYQVAIADQIGLVAARNIGCNL